MPGRAKKDATPKAHEVHPHFDGIWKDALTRWLPDCLRLFWPNIHTLIDWAHVPVFLDKELQSLRKINKKDTRYVDQLAQVRLLDGANALLLIHIEVQTGSVGAELAQRMFRYGIRLFEAYPNHTHFRCAILLDRANGPALEHYQVPTLGGELCLSFPVVNLAAWQNKTDNLRDIAPGNPFAVVVLAQLTCRATKPDETRLVSKLELAKLLKYWGYDIDLRRNLLRIIDSLLILPKALDETFFDALTQIEDKKVMHYIGSIERIYWNRKFAEREQDILRKGEQLGLRKGEQLGLRKGEQLGLTKGEQIGITQILKAQLQQKFGPLPDWASDRIQRADTETLQRWAVNVLHAESLQSVFDQ